MQSKHDSEPSREGSPLGCGSRHEQEIGAPKECEGPRKQPNSASREVVIEGVMRAEDLTWHGFEVEISKPLDSALTCILRYLFECNGKL